MRVLNVFPLVLLLSLLGTSPAHAQQVANPDDGRFLNVSAIDAALAGHELAVDRHRTELAELLSTSQVRELASERGIDMERVEAMANALSDGEVEGLAPLVTEASDAMGDGGLGNITFSVAGIIIILLILILVT